MTKEFQRQKVFVKLLSENDIGEQLKMMLAKQNEQKRLEPVMANNKQKKHRTETKKPR